MLLKASSREGAVPLPVTLGVTATITGEEEVRGGGKAGGGGGGGNRARGKGEEREGGEGGGGADMAFDRRAALIAVDAPVPRTRASTRASTRARIGRDEKSKIVIEPQDVAWDEEEEDGDGGTQKEDTASPVTSTSAQGFGQGGKGLGLGDDIGNKAPTARQTRASANQAVHQAKRLIESATAEKWFGCSSSSSSSSAGGGSNDGGSNSGSSDSGW